MAINPFTRNFGEGQISGPNKRCLATEMLIDSSNLFL